MEHAFPGQKSGKILMTISKKNGTLKLRYSDTGIGLPPGFDISETSSLGLQIIRNIIRKQLGGEIEIKIDHGAEFVIEFKSE